MHIDLLRSGSKSLPQQISETMAQRITSGLLQPGARLPSVRNLASSLKVSQVTVSKAYAELESHGHISCSQGKGCFVAERARMSLDAGTGWQDGYDDFCRGPSYGVILIIRRWNILSIWRRFMAICFRWILSARLCQRL